MYFSLQDITQQMMCNVEAVAMIEKCARFHIFSAERLCEEEMSAFSHKINDENLTKCLQSLKYLYADMERKNKVYFETEAEFRAYVVLMNLNEGDMLRWASWVSHFFMIGYLWHPLIIFNKLQFKGWSFGWTNISSYVFDIFFFYITLFFNFCDTEKSNIFTYFFLTEICLCWVLIDLRFWSVLKIIYSWFNWKFYNIKNILHWKHFQSEMSWMQ